MSERPFIIGLTGSIGMGKSETARMFSRLGIPVHDADATVHALYGKGGLATAMIAKEFPSAIKDGQVDRAGLAHLVTGTPKLLERLEALVHPLVVKERDDFLDAVAAEGHEFVVFDIPLLFETGRENETDAVVVVSAPHHLQRERVLARPGMTPERLDAIHARQVPDAEKRAKADFVIETDKGLDHAFAEVNRIMAELKRRRAERK